MTIKRFKQSVVSVLSSVILVAVRTCRQIRNGVGDFTKRKSLPTSQKALDALRDWSG
jgi:hypothetical protein